MFAAAGLFKYTEDPAYQQQFITDANAIEAGQVDPSWLRMRKATQSYHFHQLALFSYLLTDNSAVDKQFMAQCNGWLDEMVAEISGQIADRTYPVAGGTYMTSGYGTHTTPASHPLIVKHKLTGDRQYLDMLQANLSYFLGANPLNICWISGVGERNVSRMLHINSRCDTVDRIAPGLVPYGAIKPNAEQRHGAILNTLYPAWADWPLPQTWCDGVDHSDAAMAEFTIHQNIVTAAFNYGYMLDTFSPSSVVPGGDGNTRGTPPLASAAPRAHAARRGHRLTLTVPRSHGAIVRVAVLTLQGRELLSRSPATPAYRVALDVASLPAATYVVNATTRKRTVRQVLAVTR